MSTNTTFVRLLAPMRIHNDENWSWLSNRTEVVFTHISFFFSNTKSWYPLRKMNKKVITKLFEPFQVFWKRCKHSTTITKGITAFFGGPREHKKFSSKSHEPTFCSADSFFCEVTLFPASSPCYVSTRSFLVWRRNVNKSYLVQGWLKLFLCNHFSVEVGTPSG